MCMAPLLMLIDSSRRKRIAKRESEIYSGGKEKTGNIQLMYIEDIHDMGVFVAC
jgi:hypothetical protein